MEKFNRISMSAEESVIIDQSGDYDLYVGLDVHKATIAIAIALSGREPARYRPEVTNSATSVKGLVGRIQKEYSSTNILFCYEAGPCGYVLYHQLNAFVLRHGFHWPANKQRWNRGHFNWLESLVFSHPWQQIVCRSISTR